MNVGQDDDNEVDEPASVTIIEMIAGETHLPVDKVKRVYIDEYTRLKSGARITDYLVPFAARRTPDTLTRSR